MTALRQIQLQKKKSALNEKLSELTQALESNQRDSELKSLALYLGLLATAIVGRVALKQLPTGLPSVEPILPLAVLAGLLFGAKEGFVFGGSAYVVSNFFVWGFQGPWTVFQALGGALAGTLGGLHKGLGKPSPQSLMALTIFSTLVYELIMNVSGGLLGLGLFVGLLGLPIYFLTSLPFSAIHVASNVLFAKLATPFLKYGEKDETKLVSLTRVAHGKRLTVRMLGSAKSK